MKNIIFFAIIAFSNNCFAGKDQQTTSSFSNFRTYALAAAPIGLVGMTIMARRQIGAGLRVVASTFQRSHQFKYKIPPMERPEPLYKSRLRKALYFSMGCYASGLYAETQNRNIRKAAASTDMCPAPAPQPKKPEDTIISLYTHFQATPDEMEDLFERAYQLSSRNRAKTNIEYEETPEYRISQYNNLNAAYHVFEGEKSYTRNAFVETTSNSADAVVSSDEITSNCILGGYDIQQQRAFLLSVDDEEGLKKASHLLDNLSPGSYVYFIGEKELQDPDPTYRTYKHDAHVAALTQFIMQSPQLHLMRYEYLTRSRGLNINAKNGNSWPDFIARLNNAIIKK